MKYEFRDLTEAFPLSVEDVTTYRPIIVWAMNDRLEREELQSQLEGFKACGYGGVMVMPWGGLPYGFMDDEWLDMVEYICESAGILGLEVWLWDEWCFPSGSAAGKVTENPAYRAKTLYKAVDIVIEDGEQYELTFPPRTVSAAYFNVDKFSNPIGEQVLLDSASKNHTIQADARIRVVVICWQYKSGLMHTVSSHGDFLNPDISETECSIYSNDDRDVYTADMLNPAGTNEYIKLIHERYHDKLSKYFGNTVKGFFYDEPHAATIQPWTEDFQERFKAIKSYNIGELLPGMMIDYIMNEGDFNDMFRPEKIKQAIADYRDVYTSMMAESFYKPVQKWCHSKGVIATGHQLGDNSFGELFDCPGGIVFKNMAYSDMPGIDTISGAIKSGCFRDDSRFVSSIAAVSGKCRSMSETFAVYGQGVTIDNMRYVCEHQITRGINKFFVKLSNYNRKKSFYFHAPELSDYNPMIRHYGHLICERVNNLAGLLNGGLRGEAVALYIPLQNYYHDDRSFIEVMNAIAEKLTYNQIDFDYVYDKNILDMTADAAGVNIADKVKYSQIIIPPGSMLTGEIGVKFKELNQGGGIVVTADDRGLCEVINASRDREKLFSIISDDTPVAIRRRSAVNGAGICFLLNESTSTESLTIKLKADIRIYEVDLNGSEVKCIAEYIAGSLMELSLQSLESKLLFFKSVSDVKTSEKTAKIELQDITDWSLKLPDGKSIQISSEFPDWQNLGFAGYTGTMSYSAEFEVGYDCDECLLSLGKLCYAATVALDGDKVSDVVFFPFDVNLGKIAKGRHTVEITVLNTLANSIFGDAEKYEALKADGAFKGTYMPIFEPLDRQKLPSGLFGPVKLSFATLD